MYIILINKVYSMVVLHHFESLNGNVCIERSIVSEYRVNIDGIPIRSSKHYCLLAAFQLTTSKETLHRNEGKVRPLLVHMQASLVSFVSPAIVSCGCLLTQARKDLIKG